MEPTSYTENLSLPVHAIAKAGNALMGNLVRENRTQGSEGEAFPMKRNYETNFKLGVKEMPLPTRHLTKAR